jgi:hypothetical protein
MLGIGYYIWNNSKKRDHVPLQEDWTKLILLISNLVF